MEFLAIVGIVAVNLAIRRVGKEQSGTGDDAGTLYCLRCAGAVNTVLSRRMQQVNRLRCRSIPIYRLSIAVSWLYELPDRETNFAVVTILPSEVATRLTIQSTALTNLLDGVLSPNNLSPVCSRSFLPELTADHRMIRDSSQSHCLSE